MSKIGESIRQWINVPLGKVIAGRLSAWWHPPLEYPWPAELNDEVNQPESHAVCPHCFTPQQGTEWFCPECGAATGPYNNVMPYIHIFSVGEGARAGVGSKLKWSPFNICLLIVFGFIEYMLFAPVYWLRLYRNWKRQKNADQTFSENCPRDV